MTAPTPPPPEPGRPPQHPTAHAYDPWAATEADAPPAAGAEAPDGGPARAVGAEDARTWAVTAAALTALGAALGLLWWWLAPEVVYVSDGRRAFLRNNESEHSFGVDGTFVLLAAAFGLGCGALAFAVRRHGGVGVVLGLTSGGVLGSWLAAWLGGVLGPGADLTARAVEAGRGGVFTGPLELSSLVLLLVWPLVAVATHLVALGALGPREPAPRPLVHPRWAPEGDDAPPVGGPPPGPAPRG
ncbi:MULTISPECIES: ABC transporter permease [Streptomyces]|uniref:ABC transporter permease n=1 Tax=Streptomyces TaxID=1883 RepID=UPI002248F975|nr:ABC transporter permease [Streptomyces sp. JHD 1]MCX2969078.1 ABC transporter permease [Streptomyces sp. JHD 1]